MTQSSRIKSNGYLWLIVKDNEKLYVPTLSYWCKRMGFNYKSCKNCVRTTSKYKGYMINKIDITGIDIYQWDDKKDKTK